MMKELGMYSKLVNNHLPNHLEKAFVPESTLSTSKEIILPHPFLLVIVQQLIKLGMHWQRLVTFSQTNHF